MLEKVRVGIAGMGRSGVNNHADTLLKLSERYDIVAACDSDRKRRASAEERYGCRAYPDFQGLVADLGVELLVVATPNYLHAQNSIEALKAGKKVVCEKPMATSLADAELMIKTSRETGSFLTVFQSCRFTPDYLKVKDVIASGKLGRIVQIRMYFHRFRRRYDWQTLKKFGGGQLLNNGSHFLDRALDLLGDVEPEIFCDPRKTGSLGDAEDHFKVVLKAPRAPTIDVEVSDCGAFSKDVWEVMGTQGCLMGGTKHLRWKYFDPSAVPDREVDLGPEVGWDEDIPWQDESWEWSPKDKGHFLLFYEELYKTLREGGPLAVTPESSRRVIRCIEKCLKSCDV